MPVRRPLAPRTLSNTERSSVSTTSSAAASSDVTIRTMFDRIAPDYDRFNAWASLGLHQRWRRAVVRRIPPGSRILDEATGTGDLAFMAAGAGHDVFGLDFSEPML